MQNSFSKQFDVIIVGGGIIGMLTARSLQTEGLKVAILDKGRLGGEASWAAGGILSPLNPWQASTAAQSLLDEGRQKFSALAAELKNETDIDTELIQSGMLVLDVAEQQSALAWAESKNEPVDIFTQKALFAKEPNLSTDFAQALLFPNIQQVRPPNLIAAVRQSLLNRNIRVYESTPVKELLIEEDKITGVVTQNGKLHANKVIVCSGAWTNSLLQKPENIDVEPVRGQMLLYKLPEKIISHIILKDKTYVIPRQDGHILSGSTIEHVGFNNQVTQDARQSLQDIAQQLVPQLRNHEPIKQWSALRPGTQRDVPYICKHPNIAGLYLNSGHYRYGIIMSIASARIMTELITDSTNRSQITSFS